MATPTRSRSTKTMTRKADPKPLSAETQTKLLAEAADRVADAEAAIAAAADADPSIPEADRAQALREARDLLEVRRSDLAMLERQFAAAAEGQRRTKIRNLAERFAGDRSLNGQREHDAVKRLRSDIADAQARFADELREVRGARVAAIAEAVEAGLPATGPVRLDSGRLIISGSVRWNESPAGALGSPESIAAKWASAVVAGKDPDDFAGRVAMPKSPVDHQNRTDPSISTKARKLVGTVIGAEVVRSSGGLDWLDLAEGRQENGTYYQSLEGVFAGDGAFTIAGRLTVVGDDRPTYPIGTSFTPQPGGIRPNERRRIVGGISVEYLKVSGGQIEIRGNLSGAADVSTISAADLTEAVSAHVEHEMKAFAAERSVPAQDLRNALRGTVAGNLAGLSAQASHVGPGEVSVEWLDADALRADLNLDALTERLRGQRLEGVGVIESANCPAAGTVTITVS